MIWTEEQLDAIEGGGNLIVSAAAGAGKTAVLTERVARKIVCGVPVERMLILTFTRAAASEMKARITQRLTALAIEATNEETRAYLFAQSRGVGSAYISTVHAFCTRVLKRHYHALGLAPNPRIMDETESAALVMQVQDELLTELSASGDASWTRLLACFHGESAAWNAVYDTYTFLQSQPEPQAWLNDAVTRYSSPEGRTALLQTVLDSCKRELKLGLYGMTSMRDSLPPEMGSVIAVLDSDLMSARALMFMQDYDAYREGLMDMTFATMRFPKGTAERDKAPVQTVRDAFKKLVRTQRDRLFRAAEDECEAMAHAGVYLLALQDVVHAFIRQYDACKREKGVLDFNDLEHFTLAALQNSDIAAEYREKLLFIAVDEYQDSNRVQEAILAAICSKDNLFFVGDVKQSIYRFRQAEPGLFLEKLADFSGERGRRIDLNKNFRSAPEVLSAVNAVFGTLMTEDAAEMDYDARARLVFGGAQESGGAELHIIEKLVEENDEALEAAADAEVEARLVASRIMALVEQETTLDPGTGKRRKYRYSDFAVLLRSTTHAALVAETLSQCGVPCYAQLSGGYFDAIEVQILLNLLRVIDNRRQDVPLISVLLSSIGDFSAAELLQLRAKHREGTFFDAFGVAAKQDGKVAAFFEKLTRYREESLLVSVERLIGMLLDETGFYEEMGAGFAGRQRQANLDALLHMAHAFERTGARGVWSFLRHMDLARTNASVGAAQTASANVVRILTIHKSKGLEFPVVFVLQLGAKFNLSSAVAGLQMHTQTGIGLRYRDSADGTMHDTAVRAAIRQQLRHEQLAEEQRVLYVAMTRAKSRLVLVGCLRGVADKLSAAEPATTPFAVLQTGSPLGWLMLAKCKELPVHVHTRQEYLDMRHKEETQTLPPPDADLVAALETRFAWVYPHRDAARLPAKVSVSRIAGAEASTLLEPPAGTEFSPYYARIPAFDPPAFAHAAIGAPAFFGTAMHAVIERLPLGDAQALDALETPEGADAYFDLLAARGQLTAEQREIVSTGQINWLVKTPLFARMQKSPRVERELAFGYEMDAAALFDTSAEERVLMQGVIDCCFIEDGGWVLVDYKTDRAAGGVTPTQLANRHAGQLALYATALAGLSGLPVKARYIVLLRETCVVELP